MRHYLYRALDASGQVHRGIAEADSVQGLAGVLSGRGLELLQSRPTLVWGWSSRKAQAQSLYQFCFHLSEMVRAGVPVLPALGDCRDATPAGPVRDAVADLYRKVSEGTALSVAMREAPNLFGPLFVALVAAGEQSGRLADALAQLTSHVQWRQEMADRIARTTRYPIFLLLLALAVTGFMMLYVVPQLMGFLATIDSELPWLTRALIAVAEAVAVGWPYAAGLAIGGPALLAWRIQRDPRVAFWADGMLLQLPVLGMVVTKLALARFAHFFATLFDSGIGILEALETSQPVMANRVLAARVAEAATRIRTGATLSAAFAAAGTFPPLVVRMLKVGEETGQLGRSLKQVTGFYDREARATVDNAIGMLEPALTILVGSILAWVVLAVIGPIYSNLGKMGLV